MYEKASDLGKAATDGKSSTAGMSPSRMIRSEGLESRKALAVLKELGVGHRFLKLEHAPTLDLSRASTRSAVRPPGNSLTTKTDYFASKTMEEYLQKELVRRGTFKDYQVCDVGFFAANASTDDGLGWHNDFNWNGFLRPDNKSFHGWFVNSFSDDCNFTLAISTDSAFNECNANTRTMIFYVRNDDIIKPDLIVPLEKNMLVLFPYGSAHRTHIFKHPNRTNGHRLVTSFVLHHKDDILDENKIADLTDDELRPFLTRYPLEKLVKSNHYIMPLLEENSRTGILAKKMLESYLPSRLS